MLNVNDVVNAIDGLVNYGEDGEGMGYGHIEDPGNAAMQVFKEKGVDHQTLDLLEPVIRVAVETNDLDHKDALFLFIISYINDNSSVKLAEHRARRAIVERAVRSVLRPSSRR